MSTKIYNGYLVSKNMTMHQLSTWVKKIKKEIVPMYEDTCYTLYAQKTLELFKLYQEGKLKEIYEMASRLNIDIHGNTISYTAYLMNEALFKKFNDPYQLEASLMFFPIKDSHRRNKLLCLFFSKNKQYTKYFEGLDEVDEYSYFDNSGIPEGITFDSWEERKYNWEKAIGPSYVPSDSGFSFIFTEGMPFYDFFDRKKTLEYIKALATKDAESAPIDPLRLTEDLFGILL